MKFISCLSVISLVAITASTVATIVPRESQDYASIEASMKGVGTRCDDLKNVIDGITSAKQAPALLSISIDLCHALQVLTNTAQGFHCTDEQAQGLISLAKGIVDGSVDPALDQLAKENTTLASFKLVVVQQLNFIRGNFTDALNSVKGASPASESAGVQAIKDDVEPHFDACLGAYN